MKRTEELPMECQDWGHTAPSCLTPSPQAIDVLALRFEQVLKSPMATRSKSLPDSLLAHLAAYWHIWPVESPKAAGRRGLMVFVSWYLGPGCPFKGVPKKNTQTGLGRAGRCWSVCFLAEVEKDNCDLGSLFPQGQLGAAGLHEPGFSFVLGERNHALCG